MLEEIAAGIAQALQDAGINAVTAFSTAGLEADEPLVCVGLRGARLSSSGLGNYIGVCSEDGKLREMYGEKAELTLALDIYSPAPESEKCTMLADTVRGALRGLDGVSLTEFSLGEIKYDSDSRMLLSRCTASAAVYLVREKRGSSLSDFGIGEGGI